MKCPWCQKEVTIETYIKHLRVCPKYKRKEKIETHLFKGQLDLPRWTMSNACPSSPNKVHQFVGRVCIWCGAPRMIEVVGLPTKKPNFSEEQIDYMHRVTKESILNGKEVGFNILGDPENPKFGQIQTGGIYNTISIPKVINSIGIFHTHSHARALFSTRDIATALWRKHGIMCIGGESIEKKKYFSQVICYVADPSSKEYQILLKKREEFGSALSVGDWDKLNVIGQEIHNYGLKTFKKYDYGARTMPTPLPPWILRRKLATYGNPHNSINTEVNSINTEVCQDVLKKFDETGQVYIMGFDYPISISRGIYRLLNARRIAEARKRGIPPIQFEFEDVLAILLGIS